MQVNIQDYGLSKIDDDLHYIMICFKEVLISIGENEVAACLPWLKNAAPADSIAPHREDRYIQALSISFQLLNMVEENASVQYKRQLENQAGPAVIRGSWGETFSQWQQKGYSEEDMAAALAQVKVQPVLTAHPTEAKRVTVLELHRELYLLLVHRENNSWSFTEREQNKETLKALLERLWRTGEIYLEKPGLEDERNNVMYYFTQAFPEALRHSDLHLRSTWQAMGFAPEKLSSPEQFPTLEFGSWIGGDRDGHPYVTASFTESTLALHRNEALNLLQKQLLRLASSLSLSEVHQSAPKELHQAIAQRAQQFGEAGQAALAKNPYSPFRQFLNLLLLQMGNTQQNGHFMPQAPVFNNAEELQADLKLMRSSLHAMGAKRIAGAELFAVERHLQCFGFHLVKLDIRQNSSFHDKALSQILKTAGLADYDYAAWDMDKRLAFLNEELQSKRPFLVADQRAGKEADQVLSCFRVLARHIARYGEAGVGSLIVSMTRHLSDLLVVYLLMREVGLLESNLKVAPLLETIPDLQAGPEILEAFLSHPLTRQRGIKSHEVMMGYSDSSKDGGILASRWNIYKALDQLNMVAQKHGAEVCFFHGRGGTISRGGGKYHRFLDSLPAGSLTGAMKLTVQGETIAQQFANRMNAKYNLEMLLAGTARQVMDSTEAQPMEPKLYEAMATLTAYAHGKYPTLIEHSGFIVFYTHATPIDVLEQSKIGSRPARRTGTSSLSDLRAIPWVFSWSQSRFNITGWYSVGSALQSLKQKNPQHWTKLQERATSWPLLYYTLIEVETSLLNADPEVMESFAQLVPDADIRGSILAMLEDDRQKGLKEITALFGQSVEKRRSSQLKNTERRSRILDYLHQRQLIYLQEWRTIREQDPEKAARLLQKLLTLTNAIAGGLKNTG